MAMAAAKLNGEGAGIFCTLNPVLPHLLARAENHVERYAKQTTGDSDIVRRRWLLVDCDAQRAAGISATDEEHEAALARGR